ncbi:MAG: hypothetical protein AB1746_02845 [Candidatus Zixiibacteriota bacterium]
MKTGIMSLFIVIATYLGGGISRVVEDDMANVGAIINASQANARALNYLGFDQKRFAPEIDSISILCNKIKLNDSTTPFLQSEIDGKASWEVRISNAIFRLDKYNLDIDISPPAYLTIYLDSANGLPLKIMYKSKYQIEREPTAEESEKLLGVFREKYVGLPSVPPQISFWDAINKCDFYPGMAKEIIANYVLYRQEHYSEARPAWIVYMRGLPPISTREDVALQYRTNMRYVIDAENGVELLRNNLPYPSINQD